MLHPDGGKLLRVASKLAGSADCCCDCCTIFTNEHAGRSCELEINGISGSESCTGAENCIDLEATINLGPFNLCSACIWRTNASCSASEANWESFAWDCGGTPSKFALVEMVLTGVNCFIKAHFKNAAFSRTWVTDFEVNGASYVRDLLDGLDVVLPYLSHLDGGSPCQTNSSTTATVRLV